MAAALSALDAVAPLLNSSVAAWRLASCAEIKPAENKIAAEVAKELVGKTLRLLIEGYDEKEDAYVGMTDSAKAVFVKSESNIIGKFIDAKIIKNIGSKLYANA